jgi:sodium/potassium/calcium exchanger 6
LWIGIYAWIEHDANLFVFGGFPYIEICLCFTALIGIFIARFAPVDYSELSLKISFPIAFLGFLIAATWIDAIADQLVKLLTFLGVICRVPGSIMGLTVLAWGNSMGDFSANVTLAKKLPNMAITACFGGPVFNILIGLGGGFGQLNTVMDQEFAEVKLTPSIKVGLLFLAINLLLVLISGLLVNKGHIPGGYGYVALALYTVYIITSISLQYYLQNDR